MNEIDKKKLENILREEYEKQKRQPGLWKTKITARERVDCFDAEHQAEGQAICLDNWLYYPDGASRETNASGIMYDPPENQRECVKAKITYWKIKFERACNEYEHRKEIFIRELKTITNARGLMITVPDIDKEGKKEELKKLRKKARVARAKIRRLEKQIKIDTSEVQKARQKYDNEARLKATYALSEIQSMKI